MYLQIAPYADKALTILKQHGFQGYIVGGAVRDLINNIPPADYDIATNALPTDIKAIFKTCIPTGEKHGTVTVIVDNQMIEITTYRTDGAYNDVRHPACVSFTSSINADLSRRDFTINAMAYDGQELIDLFGGRDDLTNGIIQTVGDPRIRFSEDALRILRAFRFCSVLDFEIEPHTLQACLENAPLLQQISRERIYTELTKALCGKRPQALQPLLDCNGLQFLQLNAGRLFDLAQLSTAAEIRYAAFGWLCGVQPAVYMPALRAPKKRTESAQNIYVVFSTVLSAEKADLKRLLKHIPQPLWLQIVQAHGILLHKDTTAVQSAVNEIIQNNEPYTLQMLAVSGSDLQTLGITGKTIGRILSQLLDAVIQNPKQNEKYLLLELAKTLTDS